MKQNMLNKQLGDHYRSIRILDRLGKDTLGKVAARLLNKQNRQMSMALTQWRHVVQSLKMNHLKAKMMKRLDEISKQEQKLQEKQSEMKAEINELKSQNQSEISRVEQLRAKHQELAARLKEAQVKSSDPKQIVDSYTEKVKRDRQRRQSGA